MFAKIYFLCCTIIFESAELLGATSIRFKTQDDVGDYIFDFDITNPWDATNSRLGEIDSSGGKQGTFSLSDINKSVHQVNYITENDDLLERIKTNAPDTSSSVPAVVYSSSYQGSAVSIPHIPSAPFPLDIKHLNSAPIPRTPLSIKHPPPIPIPPLPLSIKHLSLLRYNNAPTLSFQRNLKWKPISGSSPPEVNSSRAIPDFSVQNEPISALFEFSSSPNTFPVLWNITPNLTNEDKISSSVDVKPTHPYPQIEQKFSPNSNFVESRSPIPFFPVEQTAQPLTPYLGLRQSPTTPAMIKRLYPVASDFGIRQLSSASISAEQTPSTQFPSILEKWESQIPLIKTSLDPREQSNAPINPTTSSNYPLSLKETSVIPFFPLTDKWERHFSLSASISDLSTEPNATSLKYGHPAIAVQRKDPYDSPPFRVPFPSANLEQDNRFPTSSLKAKWEQETKPSVLAPEGQQQSNSFPAQVRIDNETVASDNELNFPPDSREFNIPRIVNPPTSTFLSPASDLELRAQLDDFPPPLEKVFHPPTSITPITSQPKINIPEKNYKEANYYSTQNNHVSRLKHAPEYPLQMDIYRYTNKQKTDDHATNFALKTAPEIYDLEERAPPFESAVEISRLSPIILTHETEMLRSVHAQNSSSAPPDPTLMTLPSVPTSKLRIPSYAAQKVRILPAAFASMRKRSSADSKNAIHGSHVENKTPQFSRETRFPASLPVSRLSASPTPLPWGVNISSFSLVSGENISTEALDVEYKTPPPLLESKFPASLPVSKLPPSTTQFSWGEKIPSLVINSEDKSSPENFYVENKTPPSSLEGRFLESLPVYRSTAPPTPLPRKANIPSFALISEEKSSRDDLDSKEEEIQYFNADPKPDFPSSFSILRLRSPSSFFAQKEINPFAAPSSENQSSTDTSIEETASADPNLKSKYTAFVPILRLKTSPAPLVQRVKMQSLTPVHRQQTSRDSSPGKEIPSFVPDLETTFLSSAPPLKLRDPSRSFPPSDSVLDLTFPISAPPLKLRDPGKPFLSPDLDTKISISPPTPKVGSPASDLFKRVNMQRISPSSKYHSSANAPVPKEQSNSPNPISANVPALDPLSDPGRKSELPSPIPIMRLRNPTTHLTQRLTIPQVTPPPEEKTSNISTLKEGVHPPLPTSKTIYPPSSILAFRRNSSKPLQRMRISPAIPVSVKRNAYTTLILKETTLPSGGVSAFQPSLFSKLRNPLAPRGLRSRNSSLTPSLKNTIQPVTPALKAKAPLSETKAPPTAPASGTKAPPTTPALGTKSPPTASGSGTKAPPTAPASRTKAPPTAPALGTKAVPSALALETKAPAWKVRTPSSVRKKIPLPFLPQENTSLSSPTIEERSHPNVSYLKDDISAASMVDGISLLSTEKRPQLAIPNTKQKITTTVPALRIKTNPAIISLRRRISPPTSALRQKGQSIASPIEEEIASIPVLEMIPLALPALEIIPTDTNLSVPITESATPITESNNSLSSPESRTVTPLSASVPTPPSTNELEMELKSEASSLAVKDPRVSTINKSTFRQRLNGSETIQTTSVFETNESTLLDSQTTKKKIFRTAPLMPSPDEIFITGFPFPSRMYKLYNMLFVNAKPSLSSGEDFNNDTYN